jgi:4-amino-4-deoxy-L-arabinose transferase-like glycosyltransferase
VTTQASTPAKDSPSRPALRQPPLAVAGFALLGALCAFVALYHLGVGTWLSDELYYREAGRAYVHGDFSVNRENTMLAKYILGAAQAVFGDGKVAVRAPAAVAGLLTGGVLLLLGKRIGGWLAGGAALALWCLLTRPEIIGDYDVGRIQIERYFRLEVFMGLFAALALYCAWRWAERGSWRWATAAGVAVGLAAGSKAPGILALPAVMLTGLIGGPLTRRSLTQAAAVGVLAFVTVLATYAPLGLDGFDAIHDMFYVSKLRNNDITTPFVFFGKLYDNPPWWSNFWWQWKSLGTPASVAVGACLALAPFVLARRTVIVLGAALLIPIAFFVIELNYALPYYYYAWQPQLVLTCALVLAALVKRGGSARVAAALIAVPLVLVALGTIRDVAREKPEDYAAVGREFVPQLGHGVTVTWGLEAGRVLKNELPASQVAFNPGQLPEISGIVVDRAISTRRPAPAIAGYLRRHRRELVRRDVDRLEVYLPRSSATGKR